MAHHRRGDCPGSMAFDAGARPLRRCRDNNASARGRAPSAAWQAEPVLPGVSPIGRDGYHNRVDVKMNLRLFAGWMLTTAMRACGYVASYDGTIWDNPLPDS